MDEIPSGFREILPEDTGWLYNTFDTAGKRAWCYYGPFLSCYHLPPGRTVYVGTFESSTCVLARTERKDVVVNLVVPPVPLDPDVTLHLISELESRTGLRPRVQWCDAQDAARAEEFGMVAEEKEQEYFYDPSRVSAMEGPGFKSLRKIVHRVEREDHPDFRPMTKQDVPACQVLLKKWRSLQGRKHGFLLDWGYTRAALDRFGDWDVKDLAGWCVYASETLTGFALTGRMASDQACFFVAKADPEWPGMSDYLRYRVYDALSDFRLVNDAGDLDIPGLRRHKRRFRPTELRPVFSLKSLA